MRARPSRLTLLNPSIIKQQHQCHPSGAMREGLQDLRLLESQFQRFEGGEGAFEGGEELGEGGVEFGVELFVDAEAAHELAQVGGLVLEVLLHVGEVQPAQLHQQLVLVLPGKHHLRRALAAKGVFADTSDGWLWVRLLAGRQHELRDDVAVVFLQVCGVNFSEGLYFLIIQSGILPLLAELSQVLAKLRLDRFPNLLIHVVQAAQKLLLYAADLGLQLRQQLLLADKQFRPQQFSAGLRPAVQFRKILQTGAGLDLGVSLVAVQEAVRAARPDWAILLQAEKLDGVVIVIGEGAGLSLLPADELHKNAKNCGLLLLGLRVWVVFGGGSKILGRSRAFRRVVFELEFCIGESQFLEMRAHPFITSLQQYLGMGLQWEMALGSFKKYTNL